MPRCPSCRKWLSGEEDEIGARCPRCRAPLYERRTAPRPADETSEGQCVTHPTSRAVGTCQRCGNFVCSVCRSRWQRKMTCLACLERAMQSREATPEEKRAHYLQALWSMIFGVAAWALMLAGAALFAFAFRAGPQNPAVAAAVPALLFMVLAPGFVVPSLGLGAAAVRSRGDHLVLATIGLILSALMAGAIVGMIALNVWRN